MQSKKQKWRTSKEYKAWRKEVMSVCSDTCTACGKVSSHNHVHHVKCASYNPELKFEVENGTVLCKTCHMLLHTVYKKSYRSKVDEADLTDFLTIAHHYLKLSNL